MVFGAVVQALQNFATLELWLVIAAGLVIGIIFGIIPGISGMLACALILPFVFTMTAEQALPLMMTIMATQFMGGSISAILINMPGTPQSAATLIEGFPMTQRGEGGRALGAAEASSGLGNIITSLAALAMIPLILPMVMALRSADMVFIILLGITFIGLLATGSMVKGLISGGIGLICALIGYQETSGISRFTFGSLYLYDGLKIIPVALGLFAVPEMIGVATRGGTISQTKVVIKGMQDVWRGVQDVVRYKWLVLRCNIIGFICGVVPGVGASAATFIAYAHAQQTSKQREKFGTGNVEGVIACESANNACEAGALLTTLALGIPGSGIMAILLGAMLMMGIQPGPAMLTTHLDLSLTLIWVIGVSGIIAAVLCLLLAPYLSRVAFIPGRVLVPLILVLAIVGAFAFQGLINDLLVLFVFGAIGLVMRRYGYNRPALFLGYILGSLLEKYFFIALKVDGPLFFVRPISLTLITIIITAIAYGPTRRYLQRRRGASQA